MKLRFTSGKRPEGLTLRDPATLVATWFGSGLAPFASGTWGSLAALPFAWAIWTAGGWAALAAATLGVTALGVWAAGSVCRATGLEDSGVIVVDEVAGMWLTLLAAPFEPWAWAFAFVAFRAADVLKPFPAGWADRNVGGGLGVMLDDLFAAVWSAAAVWAAASFLPVEAWLAG